MIVGILIIIITFLLIMFLGLPLLNIMQVSLTGELNNWFNIVRTFVETVTIVVGGYWTYVKFLREYFPYPKSSHRVESYRMDKGFWYLSVFVTIANQGRRTFSIGPGVVIVRQISPLSPRLRKETKKVIADGNVVDLRTGRASELFVDNGQRIALDTLGMREWHPSNLWSNYIEAGMSREIQFVFFIESDAKVVEVISQFQIKDLDCTLATTHSL